MATTRMRSDRGMSINAANFEERILRANVKKQTSMQTLQTKRVPLAHRNVCSKSTGLRGENAKADMVKVEMKPAIGTKLNVNNQENIAVGGELQKTMVIKKARRNNDSEASAKPASKIPRLSIFPRMSVVNEPALGFSSKLLPLDVENIDENDVNNVLLTPEYVNDIYEYLRYLESKQTVKQNFLVIQKEMTARMRSVLIDWIINVHYQFRLLPETLYLGISIMDRFFQKESVNKNKIQLVGVTAFFIASKFEEIYPPDIKDFVVICDQLYHKRDILKMEMVILKALKFELGRPLPLHFLRRNSKAAHADSRIHTMAKYLMELTLVEYECAHWKPSLLAAVALYVTLRMIGDGYTWTPTLEYYSNYSEKQLIPYAAQLCKVILKSEKSKFQTCRKKYSSAKLLEISKSPELNCSYVKEMAKTASS